MSYTILKKITKYILLMNIFVIYGCSSTSTNDIEADKTQLLISKEWQLTSMLVSPGTKNNFFLLPRATSSVLTPNPINISDMEDIYPLIPAWRKDNTLRFSIEIDSSRRRPDNSKIIETVFPFREFENQLKEGNVVPMVGEVYISGVWSFGTPNSVATNNNIPGPKGFGENNQKYLRMTNTMFRGTRFPIIAPVVAPTTPQIFSATTTTTMVNTASIYELSEKTLKIGFTQRLSIDGGTSNVVDYYFIQTYTAK